MSVNLSAFAGAGWQFFNDNGDPLTGGKLYTYAAGTTTPAVTYTSQDGGTAHSNPIILDAAGRVADEIWLSVDQTYKFQLKDANDVLIGTYDNIYGVVGADIPGTVNVENFTGNGTQTTFILSAPPGGVNNTQVFINGVYQFKNTYSVSGTSLTFTQAPPPAASKIEVLRFSTFSVGTLNADQVIYDPAGTGAVQTTVQAKLRETVSVKDFGAVGDGVTDDTIAWQNALAALSQNILFAEKSAVYKITDTLTIPAYGTVDLNGATLNFTNLVEKEAVIVSDGVSFGNGEVYVVSGTHTAGATQLCPVSGGNESTPEGVKNVRIHNLKISTIRAGGNGILLFGNAENCIIQNIEYVAVTGTNRIGQVIALEWAGSAIQGTKHPHNILIENIKTGDIIDVNSIIWLSSVYNVTVRNVYAEGAFLLAGVFTGDLSNDYTVPEQKELVGRNITLDNLCCNNARSYGIRVYGLPSFATNIVPQSVVITNCVIRGDGATTTNIGISMTAVDSVKIINAEITGMNQGITFGQQCKNVTIQGGRVYGNRREGIVIKPPVVAAKNTIVDGVQIYKNGTAVPFSSGMVISNAIDTKVINCSFGFPPETQHDSLVIEDDTAVRTIVNNNNFLGGATGSVAIANGLTLDYAIQTYGNNNYAAVTANYGGITNTPLLQIDGGGKKVFRSLLGLEPLSGTWQVGDIVYFGNPTAVNFVGAVCTVAGTPGTWVRFGAI